VTIAVLLIFAAMPQSSRTTEALVAEARSDFQAGRYSDCREKLRQAVEQSSSSPALWSYLGLVDVQLNDLDAAISDFKKTVELAPDDSGSLFNLGLLYGRKGETASALAVYERGLKLQPDNAAANQNYALLLIADLRFRDAIPPLERLSREKPRDLAVHEALLQCYAKAGLNDAVARETQAVLAFPDLTAPDGLRISKMLAQAGQTEPAKKVVAHVSAMTPESKEAHYDLGLLLLNENRYEEAVREFGRAVQLDPATPGYSLRLAEALILWKRYGTALEFLNAVKDRFGSLSDYRFKLGVTYYGLHQFPRAIALFEQLAKEQPDSDESHFFLGNCYGAMGNLEKSEAQYRLAIQLRPNNASYHAALAQVLRKVSGDNVDEAIEHLQKAITLDPADIQSKHELALCYIGKEEFSKAVPLLEEVVAKEADLTAAHVALARVYYKLHRKQDGDRERATVERLEVAEQAKQNALRMSGGHRSE
jgi:tetratricopeptide (TPR) repeat protein